MRLFQTRFLRVATIVAALCLSANVYGQIVAKHEIEHVTGQDSSPNVDSANVDDPKSESTTAQQNDATAKVGVTFDNLAKYKWRVGAKIVTGKHACRKMLVTIPLPNDWPEQSVRMVEQNIPSSIHDLSYRDLESGVKQLVVKIRTIRPNTIIEFDMTFAVEVSEILAPQNTSIFSIPEKVPSDIKAYLGVSPGISYRNAKLRRQVKKIVEGKATGWQQVAAIYDWVRDNIEFREGEPSDNLSAFRAKSGCAEDLVGLFVAMCRAHKVPARMVWVEGHQLAEFYLVDKEDKGHWFPCNVAGLRDFGSNSDPRIILQKGDNIEVPEKEQNQKYVAEFVTGSGKSKPAVGFVRDLLPN